MSAEIISASLEDLDIGMVPSIQLDDDISLGSHKLVKTDDELSVESDGQNQSDSDPKDSGVDCDCDVPDDELADTIMKTVEHYLSDANILKDPFLLKHVRRNKEGFVSLKLLASFRKVRSLSRSWKAVSHSVKQSQLLALNSDGTKVRRLAPLPDHDETATSRSIIVSGFTSDNPSAEISDMFAKFGDIGLVRILRPGGTVPSDVKKLVAKNPELSTKICALVEFEEHASAKKALEADLGVLVVPVLVKKSKPESPKKTHTETDTSPKESPKKKKKNKRKSSLEVVDKDTDTRTRRSSSGSMSSQSSGYLSSSPNTIPNPFDSKYPRRHSCNPAGSIFNDPKSSFASLNNRGAASRDRLQVRRNTDATVTTSPWRKRKEQMMLSDSNLLASSALAGSLPMMRCQPVHTIRMPRGPDGTNGFSTRPRLPSTAE